MIANKIVYGVMLKEHCIKKQVKSDAWTWIQDCCYRTANGREAWLALVAHHEKLLGDVERAREEIARLHNKDKKVFPIQETLHKHQAFYGELLCFGERQN